MGLYSAKPCVNTGINMDKWILEDPVPHNIGRVDDQT
jgi:hypothetical protein